MQIVINLDKDDYEDFKYGYKDDLISRRINDIILDALYKGTPLPKGHGDLIDRNEIEYLKAIHDLKWGRITANECTTKIKYSAPTIIEADTESEDKE